MKNIAIIPARSGSTGIKNKNLQKIDGVSLVGRAVLSAIKSNCFDKIFISSDSEDILKEGERFGAVPIKRPVQLAQDSTRTIEVVIHLLCHNNINSGTVTLLQPTSPLRNELDIKNAMALFHKDIFKSVISACECEHHPYKNFFLDGDKVLPLRNVSDFEAPRQYLPKIFRPNGAIYINNIEMLFKEQKFFIPPQGIYLMPQERSIDIDTLKDLQIAELFIKKDYV